MPSHLNDLIGGLVGLGLMLLLAVVRRSTRDATHRVDLSRSILFFAGYLAAYGCAQAVAALAYEGAARYLRVASYLLFAFGSLRAATSGLVWLLRTRRGRVTPKILRDAVHALLYLLALTMVLRATLQVDLGGLLATSAILSVVIGLALQETLGNLFAGLALQLEPPFVVGDWISVGPRTGKVLQIAWRQTRILTGRGEDVAIPNAVIAKELVTNLSRSGQVGRDLTIEVDYDSPPNAVRQVCLDVLASVPGIRKDPPPIVRVSKWEASGVQYFVRFFAEDSARLDELEGELLALLWYRLKREGFSIPFPTRTVHLVQGAGAPDLDAQRRELASLLSSVDFLKPLGPASIEKLATRSRTQSFGRGEVILREGEAGETFYLIVSGAVSVRAARASGELRRLSRGDFFGEMSLLTGEPRSATVVAAEDATLLCVDRQGFGEVLHAQEYVAASLSVALAERTANAHAASAGAAPVHDDGESKRIFARLRDIFRLRPADP